MGLLIYLILYFSPSLYHCQFTRSALFTRKASSVDGVQPYRLHPPSSVIETALYCLEDERCLSFDASSENVTSFFTSNVCQGGTHCFETRCPKVENMRYSRTMDLCYRLVMIQTDWNSANNICGDDGGRLISLETEEKFSYIDKEFQDIEFTVWLGALWTGTRWEWLNGKELLLSNPRWFPGEPGTASHQRIASGKGWYKKFGLDDDNDSRDYHFICEY